MQKGKWWLPTRRRTRHRIAAADRERPVTKSQILHSFASVKDGWSILNNWKHHYIFVRSHGSTGKKPPVVFVKEVA